jgi:hypothetical protein
MKAKSRRRISNPPPARRSHTRIDRHRASIQRGHREPGQIGKQVGAIAAGSHASAGTVALVLIARSSAQSLANCDRILHQVRITRAITHLHCPHHNLRIQIGRRRIQKQRIARPHIGGKARPVSACSAAPQRAHAGRRLLHRGRRIRQSAELRAGGWSPSQSTRPPRAFPPAPAPAGWRRSPRAPPPCQSCDNSPQSARRPPARPGIKHHLAGALHVALRRFRRRAHPACIGAAARRRAHHPARSKIGQVDRAHGPIRLMLLAATTVHAAGKLAIAPS